VQAYIDNGSLAALVGFLGEAEAPSVENARVPEGSISAGEEVIDGVTFTYEIQLNAEATEQLVIGIPEARALVVQDLIYNSNHFFPGLDRDNWIAALEALQARTEYDTFLVGHGLPASRGVLDSALSYLHFVQATAATADDIIAAVQTQYPNYTGTGILGFWNQFFQPS